jgi:hypothetical protein
MAHDDSPGQARQRAAETNLMRLAELAGAPPGLVVAAIACERAGLPQGLAAEAGAAAVLAHLPGVAVWAWRASTAPVAIARDLAAARSSFGENTRAVLVLRPRARVLASPLAGEVGATVEGVDAVPLVRAVSALQEDELVRGVDLPWSEEATALLAGAGFVSAPPRA